VCEHRLSLKPSHIPLYLLISHVLRTVSVVRFFCAICYIIFRSVLLTDRVVRLRQPLFGGVKCLGCVPVEVLCGFSVFAHNMDGLEHDDVVLLNSVSLLPPSSVCENMVDVHVPLHLLPPYIGYKHSGMMRAIIPSLRVLSADDLRSKVVKLCCSTTGICTLVYTVFQRPSISETNSYRIDCLKQITYTLDEVQEAVLFPPHLLTHERVSGIVCEWCNEVSSFTLNKSPCAVCGCLVVASTLSSVLCNSSLLDSDVLVIPATDRLTTAVYISSIIFIFN
jgi:hypothetical protein